MSDAPTLDELKTRADESARRLAGLCTDTDVAAAKDLVEALRNVRAYDAMGTLAEAVSRHDPKDPRNRRLYAQYLIDTGKATAAIDLLRPLARRLPRTDPEFGEATGLLGRAHKQVFLDAGDKTGKPARAALKQAVAAYRKPFEADPANTWHGVNLLAMLGRARNLGLRVARDLEPADVARSVVATLRATPENQRDVWFLPTLAEASLGLGDWDAVEGTVRSYAAARDAKAFQIYSTLRQFTEVWDLESADVRGRDLVNILRARLTELPGGGVELNADDVRRLRGQPSPETGQLEAVLGDSGSQTFTWWKTGLDRAASVAAICQRLGGRIGSGFLVRAGDLGLDPADERVVLTNFHVVNAHGASPGIRPDEVEVAFEASDAGQKFAVESILWSSPPDRHDASVLRLQTPVADVNPIPVARVLPIVERTARVYIVGHPGGRDLAFSFQDNELLDHEGPPVGVPQIPDVCRVHYRAPTEGGSSGSPVFNSRLWEVVALHHKGGKLGMPRLNGTAGTYAANEGIAIHCIRDAIAEA